MLNLLTQAPEFFLLWAFALVTALTVHEFSHALVARLLGDRTAEDMGRLTLNPVAHLDPLGTVMLFLVGFGWGKPVPVNPYNLRPPRWGNVFVSAAGPVSNLLLVAVFGFGFRLALGSTQLGPDNLLTQFLSALVVINVLLFAFNLIPVPPLDGSKVLFGFLPRRYVGLQMQMERTGPLILLGVLLVDNFLGLGLFSRFLLLVGRTVTNVLGLPPIFGG